jgi:cytochrome c5
VRGVKYLATIALLAACTPPPPLVTPADADRTHLAMADLQRGRDLLLAKCGGCHDVPLPSSQTPAQWGPRMDDMAQRAGLVGDERRLIQQYLLAMRR